MGVVRPILPTTSSPPLTTARWMVDNSTHFTWESPVRCHLQIGSKRFAGSFEVSLWYDTFDGQAGLRLVPLATQAPQRDAGPSTAAHCPSQESQRRREPALLHNPDPRSVSADNCPALSVPMADDTPALPATSPTSLAAAPVKQNEGGWAGPFGWRICTTQFS
jgi:hypothetical protein